MEKFRNLLNKIGKPKEVPFDPKRRSLIAGAGAAIITSGIPGGDKSNIDRFKDLTTEQFEIEKELFIKNISEYSVYVERIFKNNNGEISEDTDYKKVPADRLDVIDLVLENIKLLCSTINRLKYGQNQYDSKVTLEDLSRIFDEVYSESSSSFLSIKNFNDAYKILTEEENFVVFRIMLENTLIMEAKIRKNISEQKLNYNDWVELI